MTPSVAESAVIQPTSTSEPPTATPPPLAARVNAEGITLAEYEAELARYQIATSRELTPEDRTKVLDDLIDQTLLAQAAAEAGFELDQAGLQSRMDGLAEKMGGQQALADWQAANGYDAESFKLALARSAAAAWMRDEIARSTPSMAEQVHAQQILFDDVDEANQIYAQLQGSADFAQLAAQYDPATRGELGWFPRGYLLFDNVEEAVFNLQVGEHSQVIESPIGYHIVQVVGRETARSLAPDVLLAAQLEAVRQWLEDQRAASQIEILSQ